MKPTTLISGLFLTGFFVVGCDLGDLEDLDSTFEDLDTSSIPSPESLKKDKGNNGKSDEAPGHNKECVPGSTQQCWCPGDGHYPTGAQHCHASGNRWDHCECLDPDVDPDTCPCPEEEEESSCRPDTDDVDTSSEEEDADPEEERNLLPENEKDIAEDWILLEGGDFVMGEDYALPDNAPAHNVHVPKFFLLQTEVTVGAYGRCVIAGSCTAPATTGGNCYQPLEGSSLNSWHTNNEDLPVNCVTWNQAQEYCAWIGGRLPTESEWEYAARSGGEDVTYPWGEDSPTTDLAVYGTTRPHVGCSTQKGNTRQGLCDMAGNVMEWTADEYQNSYVDHPVDGSAWEDPDRRYYRIRRGGNYQSPESMLKTRRRSSGRDDSVSAGVGFRCAADVF